MATFGFCSRRVEIRRKKPVAFGFEASRDHELGAGPEPHEVQHQLRDLFIGVVATQFRPVGRCEGLGSCQESESES